MRFYVCPGRKEEWQASMNEVLCLPRKKRRKV